MQQVELKPKYIVKYATLPGIFPRLKTLFGGLNYLPFFLAQIYHNLGLLPINHPYLEPNNQGRYGIISLISEVMNNLEFNAKNIDKIILLGTTVVGFILFVLFGLGLLFSLMAGPAHALVTAVITDFPEEDIAFEILDRVFGIPDVFNSNYGPIPTPFHSGLHAMLEFYNTALFILAAFVLLYYIFTIVGETAISGTLFGQRFNKVWGPLRIVIALGLLVPMGDYGLSSAQYILLHVAKYGSGLATNAWFGLNDTEDVASPFGMNTTVPYVGDPYQFTDVNGDPFPSGPFFTGGDTFQSNGLVIPPKVPDQSSVVAHIDLIYTCMYAYKQAMNIDIRPYFVKTEAGESISQPAIDGPIDPNVAAEFYDHNNILVVFGARDADAYKDIPGNVAPLCGDMVFPYKQETFPELAQLRWLYYSLVMARFTDTDLTTVSGGAIVGRPQRFAHKIVSHYVYPTVDDPARTSPATFRVCGFLNGYAAGIGPCDDPGILMNHRAFIASEFRREFQELTDMAVSSFAEGDQSVFGPTADDLNLGWAAAGLQYNRMSEVNGDIVSAISGAPYPKRFPELMEKAKAEFIKENAKAPAESVFKLIIEGDRDNKFSAHEKKIYRALLTAYDFWNGDDANDNMNIAAKANLFEGGLATIFGLTPILDIREQSHAHPLAQLSAIGRTLIENAVTNLGLAFGASFIGGAKNAATSGTGAAYSGASGFFTSLSYIGILLGVVLFYIIPFMPFLYSFFAASGWIKSIFEAMVGVPLWALAHLKIKGDGLIPREAISGYFLLLEIFIRPTLILFGLVATTAVFSALVTVLNSIWDLVSANATGMNISNDPGELSFYRNNVDQFFFLILYIITVYMMATSVFKLIDQIPHSVIRWINASVKSFGDMAKDPAEGLYQYASMATYKFGPKIGEGVSGLGEAAGSSSGIASALKKG